MQKSRENLCVRNKKSVTLRPNYNEMEEKKMYIAPALLEDVRFESESAILYASKTVNKKDFEEVETMGQVVDNGITLEHKWE